MSLDVNCPEDALASAPRSAPARGRRVHPLTWVAAAVLLPLVCWDISQARYDVRSRRQASVQHTKLPTATTVSAPRSSRHP